MFLIKRLDPGPLFEEVLDSKLCYALLNVLFVRKIPGFLCRLHEGDTRPGVETLI
jgi:hypothetical protein